MTQALRALTLCAAVGLSAAGLQAQGTSIAPHLARLFGDGMVVQRNRPVPVWGFASPGTRVAGHLDARAASATTDASGRFRLTFPALPAGGPHTLTVDAGNTQLVVHDILAGDVWLASGQSNMEFTLDQARNAAAEIAAAHDSSIREFKIPVSWDTLPQRDLTGGSWSPADPQHAGRMSAVAYFFARDLRRAHPDVPIGIVNSTWGGSAIETWLSTSTQKLPAGAPARMMETERRRLDSLKSALQARLGNIPEQDPGLQDSKAVWADPSLDDSQWKTLRVPGYWENQGYADVDGIGWYRTSFTLTADDVARAAQGAKLVLGAIDDNDITWVNGVEVGRTNNYLLPRTYTVPASALHTGTNVIAVRVSDYGGNGGIGGTSIQPHLEIGGTTVALPTTWKFRLGQLMVQLDGQRINKVPAVTYDAMIVPLLDMPLEGAIWYQGESNANNAAQAVAYRQQFRDLITSWRHAFDGGREGAFPFLWVQLPGFNRPDSVPPVQPAWALQREAMDGALSLPKTGRAVTIDLGEADNIHPKNKQDVGKRLSLVARRVAYHERVHDSGPTYRSHRIEGGRITITFEHVDGGLVTERGDSVGGFTIAGADHRFHWASAKIQGSTVIVWNDSVPHPVAVRYAWADNPVRANLYNRDSLPAAPFRTDAWPPIPEPKRMSAAEDHADMMRQLGIRALRPGPSGNEKDANHANLDEAKAGPTSPLPDALTFRNGTKVTTAAQWPRRRAELVDDFEREVYGRIPSNVPKVTWTVTATDTGTIGGRHVIAKQLVGHADNSTYPLIDVDIPAALVLPADAKGPVPVVIMFSFGGDIRQALGRPMPPTPGRPAFRFPAPPPGSDAPATEQAIVDGWGFVQLSPNTIQADNGAGLTSGIIGLTNRGQPRTPQQWGALRAWAWGASRVLDYLQTDKAVNAKQVAIEGVSRYGKAALVTLAFDPRFAAALVGSSGEGGAKLHRHNVGESVESLTGTGEYHWMAGNFLKYGASSASFGSRTAYDLPVDSHELIALGAPRLVFISYGSPAHGDPLWVDAKGSYMAAVAAQPVFRLLGAKDMGVSDDYMRAEMPPIGHGLLDGALAWRQHDGGHTDAPNWKYFLAWADAHFGRPYTAAPPVAAR